MGKISITAGGKGYVQNASKLLSKAFETDPVITYMLQSLNPEKRLAYMPTYFNSLFTAAASNRATFLEANDWSSCAVLMPPGAKVDNPLTLIPSGLLGVLWMIGIAGCRRMLGEFTPLTDSCKKKGLNGQDKYYYVFFVGTTEEMRNQGLAAALLDHYKNIAAREHVPIWLEATTAYSRDYYAKRGFELVDEMVLGKGKAAPDGTPQKGGEGVPLYGMVWWPEHN